MDFYLVEYLQAITFRINTSLKGSGSEGDPGGANHGGSALEGMSFAAEGGRVGGAHGAEPSGCVLEEGGEDFLEARARHGAAEAVKDGEIEDGRFVEGLGRWGGRGVESECVAEGVAEGVRGEGLFEDGIEALDGRRRGSGHGEDAGGRGGAAQAFGERGTGEAGHEQVGKDAVGGNGGGEKIEGLGAAVGLEDGPAVGLEEDGGDGEADGVVVDDEDAARLGGKAGVHEA